MQTLSLRTRLLAGLGGVVLVLGAVAWAITAITRSYLIEQVDNTLVAATDPGRDARFAERAFDEDAPPPPPDGLPPERLGSMFEGTIDADGQLVVLFEPNLPGQVFSPPDLAIEELVAAMAGGTGAAVPNDPLTVSSVDGEVRYRVLTYQTREFTFVRALPLNSVDDVVRRLVLFQTVGLLAIVAVLAALAWWVIRLGIRPINTMAQTAETIAAGDLSVRVPEQGTGTEAGNLARAFNVMLGRIEDEADRRQRSEERLRQFVADASHELRTPTTTIRGYAELYRMGGLAEKAELDDAMRRTENEALRMGRLVEDMLTLAKLDQQPTLDKRPVGLSRLITDTVDDHRVSAPDHRFVLTGLDPGAPPTDDLTVDGDEDRLRQVLANVVGNAVRHTPAGCTVTVGAKRTDDGRVRITVADDGPGIDSEHLPRLSQRFYRVDPSRARDRGGSGLGMAIVQSVMTAHDGTLDVASEPGRGTTVSLIFPAAEVEKLSANSQPGQPDF
jgi:two-component system OmpR family sensor kinase